MEFCSLFCDLWQHKSKHLKAILQFSQFDLLQTFRYANGTTENKFGAEIAEVIA